MQPAFIDWTGIDRSHLTFIQSMTAWIHRPRSGLTPDRWSWRTCNLAFLFRAYGERTGKTPIHLSKTVSGKLSCPLALYIEKSLVKYRIKNKACRIFFSCKPYTYFSNRFRSKLCTANMNSSVKCWRQSSSIFPNRQDFLIISGSNYRMRISIARSLPCWAASIKSSISGMAFPPFRKSGWLLRKGRGTD